MITRTTSTGTNDGDVLYTSQEIPQFSDHYIQTSAGAVDVEISIDGSTWSGAVALLDMASTSPGTEVVATAGTGVYRLRGRFMRLRIKQSGATASTAVVSHRE